MSYTSNYNLNQRISYLESIIQQIVPSLPLALDNILANGNSAGTYDIDLNGNDILNVNEIDVLSNTPIVSIVDASLPTKFINLDGSVPNITITDGINTNVITPLGSGGTTTNSQNVETTSVSNNQSYYPTFVGADNGFNPIRVDTQLRYNPSTDTLDVPNVSLTNINGSAYPPVVPADTLSAVLTAGNDAGGQSITNINNIQVSTINGGAYPPVVPADTLSAVLLAGNSAGATDINLNFNDIKNANEIDFVSGANTASLLFDPLAPANFEINCSGDLELRPTGSIDCNGATIDLTNGRIIKCDDIESPNNVDLNIICKGTADFVVQTNSIDRLTISDTGSITFQGGMSYNNATNTLTAGTFSGALNGNASTATTSVGANNLFLTDDNTNGSYPLLFSKLGGGATRQIFVDNTTNPITCNPATSTITATNFDGNATSATTATNATNTAITASATNATFYPTFVSATTGNLPQLVDTNLTYNPSTDVMTFGAPPVCATSASTTNQLVNWNNFVGLQSYNPVLQDNLGNTLNSANYNDRVGRFIQIGDLVWFQIRLSISGKGGLGVAGNDIQITLPTSAGGPSSLTQALTLGNITGMNNNIVSAFAQIPTGNQNYFVVPIKTGASTGTANATVGDISTSFQIRVGGFYFA